MKPEPDYEFVEDWEDAFDATLDNLSDKLAEKETLWEQLHPKPAKYRTLAGWERDRESFIEAVADQAAADWDADHPKSAAD